MKNQKDCPNCRFGGNGTLCGAPAFVEMTDDQKLAFIGSDLDQDCKLWSSKGGECAACGEEWSDHSDGLDQNDMCQPCARTFSSRAHTHLFCQARDGAGIYLQNCIMAMGCPLRETCDQWNAVKSDAQKIDNAVADLRDHGHTVPSLKSVDGGTPCGVHSD